MDFSTQFKQKLLQSDSKEFESLALELFVWQAKNNLVYKSYLSHLSINSSNISAVERIPCLPIEFFKHHRVVSAPAKTDTTVFESSGTTGQQRSKHYVTDISWYHQVCALAFTQRWGNLDAFDIFALLPSYLERSNASLVAMVDFFIKKSNTPRSGFYLNNYEQLIENIERSRREKRKVLLIGVTFALLELAEMYTLHWPDVIVMETGGMKGRRKELTRSEVHDILTQRLGIRSVASEYGMTELLSQAYAQKDGKFEAPSWMNVFIRDIYDPFSYVGEGKQGGINIIDLANIDSCAFIETKDLGRKNSKFYFEVLGRYDNSEIRGCNLML